MIKLNPGHNQFLAIRVNFFNLKITMGDFDIITSHAKTAQKPAH